MAKILGITATEPVSKIGIREVDAEDSEHADELTKNQSSIFFKVDVVPDRDEEAENVVVFSSNQM